MTRLFLIVAAVLAGLGGCGGQEAEIEVRPEYETLSRGKADDASWASQQSDLLGCPQDPGIMPPVWPVVQQVSGDFDGYDSAHLYRLKGNGEEITLTFTVDYPSFWGAAIAVYDDDGQRVAHQRNDYGTEASVGLQTQVADYLVAVHSVSIYAVGSYTLTLGCEPVVKRCGGFLGLLCDEDQYCDYPQDSCGYADHLGQCKARPQACPRHLAPVCGCDGQTYGNECTANAAGVDIHHEGACEPPVRTCGGFIGQLCEADEYCDYAQDSCGYADEMGICEKRPHGCPRHLAPVCGCDGQTYGNECAANAAGVDILHDGPCDPPPPPPIRTCGGFLGQVCAEDQYCDYPQDSCGYADHLGQCKARPQACPRLWAPVCGCDGQTYGNECAANAAGVDIHFDGPC